ncbi:MAG TPA: PilZ domain-containing protein [Polyangiales bacterium]|nr:PilZ domain-containing protein [Polyangiales bacterium]
MGWSENRETLIPVGLDGELVAEEEVLPAFITGIAEHGLRLDSLAILANRSSNRVHLQLTLPGEPRPLWIGAEVIRDRDGFLLHEVVVRFVFMADADQRRLERWVRKRLNAMTAPAGELRHAA